MRVTEQKNIVRSGESISKGHRSQGRVIPSYISNILPYMQLSSGKWSGVKYKFGVTVGGYTYVYSRTQADKKAVLQLSIHIKR